jgi:predicted transcriptional regulator
MKASSLVKQARRKAGFSQRALAAAARVPQSTVGRIEAGLIDPRASTLHKLLDACSHELEAGPRLGDGVDRTQIRRLLDLSPRERVESAAAAAANVGRLVRKSRKRK